jgi:hypothetical protein
MTRGEVEARQAPRLAAWIMEHARHDHMCRAGDCPHCPHDQADDRVACAEYPCSCGLAGILDDLDPSIVHQLEDEDEPDPVPADFGHTP